MGSIEAWNPWHDPFGAVQSTTEEMSRTFSARLGRRFGYVASGWADALLPTGEARLRFLEKGRRFSGIKVGVGLQRHFFNSLGWREPVEGWTTTNAGVRLYVSTADIIERTILIRGEWEPGISAVLASLLRPGDHFVDVGAHVGHHSLLAGTVVGGTGRVWAIEANPRTYERLVRNVEANPHLPVSPILKAASDDQLRVSVQEGPPGNSGMARIVPRRELTVEEGTARPVDVGALPLDEIVPEVSDGHPTIVKLDIEGAESGSARGLRRLMAQVYPNVALIVESHAGADRSWLRELRSGWDLAAFSVENSVGLGGQYPSCRPWVRHVGDIDGWPGSDFVLVGPGLLGRVTT